MIRRHYDKVLFLGVLVVLALFIRHLTATETAETKATTPTTVQPALQTSNPPGTPASSTIPSAANIGALSSSDAPSSAAFVRAKENSIPEIAAEIGLVADLETGEVYYDKQSTKVWPMASLTKLMTALTVVKTGVLGRSITLTSKDFSEVGGDDSGGTLRAGETYSGSDLFKAMLLFSSNEAAEAFANSYGRTSFISEMNREATRLGLDHTEYHDVTGLSSQNRSTAMELYRLSRELYRNYPTVFETTRNASADIVDLNTSLPTRIYSNNQFVNDKNFLGGKTGFTDEARQNLLTVFSHGGRPYVIVVMGVTSDRFLETAKLRDWFIHTYKASI